MFKDSTVNLDEELLLHGSCLILQLLFRSRLLTLFHLCPFQLGGTDSR